MLCSARKKSRDSTEMQETKQQQKNGLNMNLTRSEGNGALEEKAKEIELFDLKEKDPERCEKQLPV